ncbi:MAG: hypothetical protein HC888_18895 [Candidatus Competibacteraceae bacterium]|nr:hypothetical protein [Candidatus Competibacteraceae bacterium]
MGRLRRRRLIPEILPQTRGRQLWPLIAKPSREDASLGISSDAVCHDLAGLQATVERLHGKYRQPILIERFLDGREFNAAILEVRGRPEVLPISEILFTEAATGGPRLTSYEAKWIEDSAAYRATPPVCPADLDDETRLAIGQTALRVFRLLGGRDYGRVDLRLDGEGRPRVLEYNPNPDISPDAGYCRSLTAAGWSYSRFVEQLLENGRVREDRDGKS